MKEVVVHPERCVGCKQCMLACTTAHSKTKSLLSAVLEEPKPHPRVHVGAGIYGEGFPNRCRHCDPAPCLQGCLPGAIYRYERTQSVLIDPDRCINCLSCAMACPFGVIRYHQDALSLPGKTIAIKCDNCMERQAKGIIPACVESCMTGALTFEECNESLRRKTKEVAIRMSLGAEERTSSGRAPGFALLTSLKQAQTAINERLPRREARHE
jgi:carbon-monoxide dehydrogenase iron sulfur subunit